MLIGQYEANITEGNRVAIPKKFRTELGKNFIVAKWYENCLVLVANKNWDALLQRVTGVTRIVTAPVRRTDRFILGSAFEISPDTQGRTVIPKQLVEFANLKADIVFVGLGDRVEVWNKSNWITEEGAIAHKASDLLESINNE